MATGVQEKIVNQVAAAANAISLSRDRESLRPEPCRKGERVIVAPHSIIKCGKR